MDSYFDKKCQLRVLNIIKMDLLLKTWNVWRLKTLTDGLEWCGLFLSAVWTHSDGTHSLQSIHLWASKGMTHFSKSDEETNSSTSRITWGEDIFSKSSFLAELFKATWRWFIFYKLNGSVSRRHEFRASTQFRVSLKGMNAQRVWYH